MHRLRQPVKVSVRLASVGANTEPIAAAAKPSVSAAASTAPAKSGNPIAKLLLVAGALGGGAVATDKVLGSNAELRDSFLGHTGEPGQKLLEGCRAVSEVATRLKDKAQSLVEGNQSPDAQVAEEHHDMLLDDIKTLTQKYQELEASCTSLGERRDQLHAQIRDHPAVVAALAEVQAKAQDVVKAEKEAATEKAVERERDAWQDRITILRDEHAKNLIMVTGKQEEMHQARVQKQLEETAQRMKEQADKEKEEAITAKIHEFNIERMEKFAEIEAVKGKVRFFENALNQSSEFHRRGHQLHQIALAVGSVKAVLESAKPLQSPLAFLEKTAGGNDIVRAALSSLDPRVRSNGVCTAAELSKRFPKVLSTARRVALVPEDSGIWGELLAFVTDLLTFRRPLGMPSAKDESAEAVLRRAELHMARGDLRATVLELERLEGRPARVVSDWAAEARRRAVLQQAVVMVGAEECVMAESMS